MHRSVPKEVGTRHLSGSRKPIQPERTITGRKTNGPRLHLYNVEIIPIESIISSLASMDKAIRAKLNERTFCHNCHESKLCARLTVSQCVAIIYLCGDCIDELKQPLKHPDADKPLE
jgi:hypothetical protein